MAEKKKRRRPRSYLEDFAPSVSGGYEFTGEVWRFRAERGSFRDLSLKLWLLSAGLVAAALVPGFSRHPAMLNCFYVILPFAAGVFATAFAVTAALRIALSRGELRGYRYEKSVKALPSRAVAAAVCSLAGAAAIVVYSLLNPGDFRFWEIAALIAADALLAACALRMRQAVRLSVWDGNDQQQDEGRMLDPFFTIKKQEEINHNEQN